MHAASDMIVLYKTQQLYIIKHSPGPFLSETQLWPVANPYNRHWTDRQCDHILYSLESTPTYLCCNRYCSSQGLIPRLCWRRKWPENKATVMNCRYDATTSMKISAFKILRFEISARSTRLVATPSVAGGEQACGLFVSGVPVCWVSAPKVHLCETLVPSGLLEPDNSYEKWNSVERIKRVCHGSAKYQVSHCK